MRKYIKKQYEALGFVEALIAIMIAGVSSVALMQIAVHTIQNTVQNEAIDEITQRAVEGGTIVRDIAERNKRWNYSEGEEIFPSRDEWETGRCYSIQKRGDGYAFVRDLNNPQIFLSFSKEEDRGIYKDKEENQIEESKDLFRIVCLEIPEDIEDTEEVHFLIAKIIVGQNFSDGSVTRGNLVKDYEYLTIIKL